MTEDPSEGFLGRWSRAKRAASKSVPDPVVAADPPVPEPEPESAPEAETLSEEELAALPRIEDLTEGSDIRAFLRAGVPRVLRNAAMRKIWMLTPAIRDYRDPAVDYAWDWNTPGGVPGDGSARAAAGSGHPRRPRPRAPASRDAREWASPSAVWRSCASDPTLAAWNRPCTPTPRHRPTPRPLRARGGAALRWC
jgi:hypothetical protein